MIGRLICEKTKVDTFRSALKMKKKCRGYVIQPFHSADVKVMAQKRESI
jgi:hypothetical protein